MSYFIRTPHTIFEVVSENDRVYFVKAKNKKNVYSKSKCQTQVLAQADTIEELCDYWDYYDCLHKEYTIKPIYVYRTQGMILDLKRGYIKDVKLCIRTDKGLIYAAKMNDEGELELL